jgi:hypothetical protein
MENRILHVVCDSIEGTPDGVFTTFRNGRKWADMQPGTVFDLCVCGQGNFAHAIPEAAKIVGQGEVLEVEYLPFHELRFRSELVQLCHNPNSRTYEELTAAMQRAYGDSWHCEAGTTVLIYRRLPAKTEGDVVPAVAVIHDEYTLPPAVVKELQTITAEDTGSVEEVLGDLGAIDKTEPIISDQPVGFEGSLG